MSNPWRAVGAAVLIALISTACTSSDTPSAASERALAPVDSATLASPAELPPAFSPITSVGAVAVYYAIIDASLRLIAFDPATGEGRYQIQAHPLGRIPTAQQDLIVDNELGLVFLTGTTDETSAVAGFVAAHNAETGAEVWRQPIGFFNDQPRDCGTSLCLRSLGEQLLLDKATGNIVELFEVSDRRLLLDHRSLWLTNRVSTGGRFLGLEAVRPGIRSSPLWEISVERIEELTGSRVDPGFGGRADFDETNDAVIVYLANAEGTAWVAFGAQAGSGEARWGRDDFAPCVLSPFDDLPPITCRVNAGGTKVEIALLNADSGLGRWALPLDGTARDIVFDGNDLLLFRETERASTYQRIDLSTGEARLGEVPALCRVSVDDARFAWPDGSSAMVRSGPLYTLCDETGVALRDEDVRAAAAGLDIGNRQLWLVGSTGAPLVAVG